MLSDTAVTGFLLCLAPVPSGLGYWLSATSTQVTIFLCFEGAFCGGCQCVSRL